MMQSFNVGLVAAAGWLVVLCGQSLLEHWSLDDELPGPEQSQASRSTREQKAEHTTQLTWGLPEWSQFQIVVDRDPFRPLPDATVDLPPPPGASAIQKPKLPPLMVTLSGTIVIGDERKAILKDSRQEDVYSVGQAVAGGVLTAVESDRVVIARGSEKTEVLLKGAMEGDAPLIAGQPMAGRALGAGNRQNAPVAPGKSLFATPAFARYPGVGTQSKGNHAQ